MQPYFFPYIGYFQLMNQVEDFVVYDNIKYTKKGWINRNRILVNGKDEYLSIPLKKDSDYLNVDKRFLADNWSIVRDKMLNKIFSSYNKAPFFNEVYPIIKKCILFEDKNLFNFIFNSIIEVKEYLGINSNIIKSSNLSIDHDLKSEKKIISICKEMKSYIYINPIGGKTIYNFDTFKKEGILLKFIKTEDVFYKQYNNDFISFLSIIDVMMFNSRDKIKQFLNECFIFE